MAFSGIPLPRVVYDVEAGGPFVTAAKGVNALRKSELENEYYGPEKEAEIAYRNALAKGQGIENEYMPEKLKQANAFAQLQNQYYAPNIMSEIGLRGAQTNKMNTMTPLEAEELKLKNQYYPQATQAEIGEKNARAKYMAQGGAATGVAQKELNSFSRQLEVDNPMHSDEDVNSYSDRINLMKSAYLNGEDKMPDGTPLPPLSGTANTIRNGIFNRNVPVAVRNQLSNMSVLLEDLKSFDLDAVKSFAGPQGKAKLAYAQAQMVTNPNDPNIDPMARRYLSAMNQSIINMDSMRKAFGTSVVPEYVYKTVGRLTNPADSIWNDPKQVEQSYNDVVKTIEHNHNMLAGQYQRGLVGRANTNKENSKEASQMGKPVRVTTDGKVKVRDKKTKKEGFIPVDRLETYEANGYERV